MPVTDVAQSVFAAATFHGVYEAAAEGALTAYDAAYLELAVREAIPLATLDDDLRAAARRSGVRLVAIA